MYLNFFRFILPFVFAAPAGVLAFSDDDYNRESYGRNHIFKEAGVIIETDNDRKVINIFSGTLCALQHKFNECIDFEEYENSNSMLPRDRMVTCASGFKSLWEREGANPQQTSFISPRNFYVSFSSQLVAKDGFLDVTNVENVEPIAQVKLNPYYIQANFVNSYDTNLSDYAVVYLQTPKGNNYTPLPIFPLFYDNPVEAHVAGYRMRELKEKDKPTKDVVYVRKGTYIPLIETQTDAWYYQAPILYPEVEMPGKLGNSRKKRLSLPVSACEPTDRGAGVIMTYRDSEFNQRRRLIGLYNSTMRPPKGNADEVVRKSKWEIVHQSGWKESAENGDVMIFTPLYSGVSTKSSLRDMM